MAYMISKDGEAFETSNPEWHKECEQVSQKKMEACPRSVPS